MPSGRSGNNAEPLPPQQATLDLLVASTNDTNPGARSGAAAAGAGAHLGVWGTVGIVAGGVGAGLGVGLTRGGRTRTPNGCIATQSCWLVGAIYAGSPDVGQRNCRNFACSAHKAI